MDWGSLGGLAIVGKERIIVSVVERITRQILPLLIVAVGLSLLVERFFFNTSQLFNPDYAVLLCAVAAPAVQVIGVLLGKSRKHKAVFAALDVITIVLGVAIVKFGEYVAVDMLGIPTVKYSFAPGTAINTTASLIASLVVIGIAVWPLLKKKAVAE